jgi:hypothetical protein
MVASGRQVVPILRRGAIVSMSKETVGTSASVSQVKARDVVYDDHLDKRVASHQLTACSSAGTSFPSVSVALSITQRRALVSDSELL